MSSAPAPRAPGTMRIATWNVWWRFGDDAEARADAIADTLADVDADVVALQEVYSDDDNDDAERLGDRLGFEVVATEPIPGRDRNLANALLSRWPVIESGSEPLVGGNGQPGPRRALWARIGAPFGVLAVICTHLAYRFDESELRRRQLGEVLALAADLREQPPEEAAPVVLAGDLNAVPDSDEIRMLTGRSATPVPGLVFVDTWPLVRDDPGHTWVRRNPHLAEATWPERRLDYVMTSWPRRKASGRAVAAHLIGDGPHPGVWPSDHLGVAVDLTTGARLS